MTVQLIMTVVPAKWNEGVLKRYSVGRLKNTACVTQHIWAMVIQNHIKNLLSPNHMEIFQSIKLKRN